MEEKIIVPCEHCGKTLDLNQEDTCNYCGLSCFLEPLVDVKLNQHALDSIQSTSGSIELVDVSSRPNNWEDFIEAWIQNRVKFNQNEVYEEVYDNSIVKQWYPVHPKGSSNRRWMEEKMMSDIKHILNKKNE